MFNFQIAVFVLLVAMWLSGLAYIAFRTVYDSNSGWKVIFWLVMLALYFAITAGIVATPGVQNDYQS